MKDNDHILTLRETEQLCRMYLDCQLSVLEERELQYILGKVAYRSEVIDEAREAMLAEGLVFKASEVSEIPKTERKRPRLRRIALIAGAAAAVAILLGLPVAIGTFTPDSGESVVIAYEGGRKLGGEASRKMAGESMKHAESLMAMAEAREREAERINDYFMNLKTEE